MTAESTQPQQRVVRVFISSTFRDMHMERDVLIKRTFPELRKRFRDRDVELVDVDLRWGVTEEAVERGEFVGLCLDEVRNCRPYFLGLLGERYGSTPPVLAPELIANESWISDLAGASVTELEIAHGVLNDVSMRSRAFFYFRDSAFVETIADAQRADFICESASARQRLALLKQRIRDSAKVVRETFSDVEQLHEWVLEDLTRALEIDFPTLGSRTPAQREEDEQAAYGRSRRTVFIANPAELGVLDTLLCGPCRGLLVCGAPGSGKSALLANWTAMLAADKAAPSMFIHYVGGSEQSTHANGMLRRLLAWTRTVGGFNDSVPAEDWLLPGLLPDWLARAAGNQARSPARPLLIVIDALDQFADTWSRSLSWLPNPLPAGTHWVLSTVPDETGEALDPGQWTRHSMLPMEPQRCGMLVEAYLERYRKTLEAARRRRLLDHELGANPLFLTLVLDELRVRGRHESIDTLLDCYLAMLSIPALYARILEDLEDDAGPLVASLCRLLWAARRALSEAELRLLLGDGSNPLPGMHFSLIHLALDRFLLRQDGRLVFFHEQMRKAVELRYASSPDSSALAHAPLAAIVRRWNAPELEASLREYALRYGADHLSMANDSEALWSLLSDPAFLRAQHEAFGSWNPGVESLSTGLHHFACATDAQSLPRLAWLALRGGEVGRETWSDAESVRSRLRHDPLDDPSRANYVLNHLRTLDDLHRYHFGLLLIWEEAARQLARTDRTADSSLVGAICDLIEETVAPSIATVNYVGRIPVTLLVPLCRDLVGLLAPGRVAQLLSRASATWGLGTTHGLVALATSIAERGAGWGWESEQLCEFVLQLEAHAAQRGDDDRFRRNQCLPRWLPRARLVVALAQVGSLAHARQQLASIEDARTRNVATGEFCAALARTRRLPALEQELAGIKSPWERVRCGAAAAVALCGIGERTRALTLLGECERWCQEPPSNAWASKSIRVALVAAWTECGEWAAALAQIDALDADWAIADAIAAVCATDFAREHAFATAVRIQPLLARLSEKRVQHTETVICALLDGPPVPEEEYLLVVADQLRIERLSRHAVHAQSEGRARDANDLWRELVELASTLPDEWFHRGRNVSIYDLVVAAAASAADLGQETVARELWAQVASRRLGGTHAGIYGLDVVGVEDPARADSARIASIAALDPVADATAVDSLLESIESSSSRRKGYDAAIAAAIQRNATDRLRALCARQLRLLRREDHQHAHRFGADIAEHARSSEDIEAAFAHVASIHRRRERFGSTVRLFSALHKLGDIDALLRARAQLDDLLAEADDYSARARSELSVDDWHEMQLSSIDMRDYAIALAASGDHDGAEAVIDRLYLKDYDQRSLALRAMARAAAVGGDHSSVHRYISRMSEQDGKCAFVALAHAVCGEHAAAEKLWRQALTEIVGLRDKNEVAGRKSDLLDEVLKHGRPEFAIAIADACFGQADIVERLIRQHCFDQALDVLRERNDLIKSAPLKALLALVSAWERSGHVQHAEALLASVEDRCAREDRSIRQGEWWSSWLFRRGRLQEFRDSLAALQLSEEGWINLLGELAQTCAMEPTEQTERICWLLTARPANGVLAYHIVRQLLLSLLRHGRRETYNAIVRSCPQLRLGPLLR